MVDIQVTVLFFGQILDFTKVSSLTLTGIQDTDTVMNRLQSMYPKLAIESYQIALDKELIHENVTLTATHTIAILPPYAGG